MAGRSVIVSAVRTAVGKAGRGALRQTRPDDMAAEAIKGALARVPAVEPGSVEDVILGCAMPEAEQGMNVARIASLLAGLPVTAAAVTVNRFCSSGLQAIAMAADSVASGRAEVAVAGGTESMSLIPMGGHRIAPNPTLSRSAGVLSARQGVASGSGSRSMTCPEQAISTLRTSGKWA